MYNLFNLESNIFRYRKLVSRVANVEVIRRGHKLFELNTIDSISPDTILILSEILIFTVRRNFFPPYINSVDTTEESVNANANGVGTNAKLVGTNAELVGANAKLVGTNAKLVGTNTVGVGFGVVVIETGVTEVFTDDVDVYCLFGITMMLSLWESDYAKDIYYRRFVLCRILFTIINCKIMSNNDYMPRRDSDFNDWTANFLSVINSKGGAWGIPTTVITDLNAKRTTWTQKYTLYISPATRTKLVTEQKNMARHALESTVRSIVNEYINFNHEITNDDRLELGLIIYKTTRTRTPVPVTIPTVEIYSRDPMVLVCRFRDELSVGYAKPDGVHGMACKYGFGNGSVPTGPDDVNLTGFATDKPLVLTFAETDRGRHVYLYFRWENTRGEAGPWTVMYSAIVP
jgi:hypothetical protein